MSYNNLPIELKTINQWMVCKDKIPFNCDKNIPTSCTEAENWLTYEEAIQKMKKGFDIGIVAGNGLSVIDIDGCIDSNGNISAMAKDIIESMNSYTEYSKSQHGIHIYYYGTLPNELRKKIAGLEFYSEKHIFVVTGDIYPGSSTSVHDRQDIALMLHQRYMQGDKSILNNGNISSEKDDDLLRLLECNSNFKTLANMPVHPSEDNPNDETNNSVVDLNLCRIVAEYTADKEQIKRILINHTERYRGKWTYNKKYLDTTIDKVIKARYNKPENLSKIRTFLDSFDQDNDIYYITNKYHHDIEDNKKSSHGKTGFSEWDLKSGGLYSGLYVVAGAPSAGKTTFCLQLAMQLAELKKHVLYFSLEQKKDEIISKNIVYQYHKNCIDSNENVMSNVIRYGNFEEERAKGESLYLEKVADYLTIKEASFNTTIKQINSYINLYISRKNIKPIIIIDYFQLISNDGVYTHDERIKINQVMCDLKNMQKELNIPVLAICSINRDSYLKPITYKSLKESGQIEFSANVILALELDIYHDKEFRGKKEEEKQEYYDKKEAKIPREIVLRCIKNRSGCKHYECKFKYYPHKEIFVSTEEDAQQKIKEHKEKVKYSGTQKRESLKFM